MNRQTNTITCEQCKYSVIPQDRATERTLLCNNPNPTLQRSISKKTFSCGYGIMKVTNSKQRRTLEKIFEKPTPNNILWKDIESLLNHIGCMLKYPGGSIAKISKGEARILDHRPHPGNQTPSRTTGRIRIFLADIGVMP